MNTLGTMAMGLMLGDSAVAAYLDIARCKNCGCGLFQQTTNSGYRVMNTKNNYPRTASYYNIQRRLSETPMPMKRFFNGNIVSAFNVDGMDIGWAYTTDLNQNKLSRGYVSSADFDEFQRLLRGEQIYRNNGEEDYQKRFQGDSHLDNAAKIESINLGKPKLSRGDYYKIPEENEVLLPEKRDNIIDSKKQAEFRQEDLNRNSLLFFRPTDTNSNSYKEVKSENEIYSGDFNASVTERILRRKPSNLLEFASKIRDKMGKDRFNPVILEYGLRDDILRINDEYDNKLIIKDELYKNAIINQNKNNLKSFIFPLMGSDGLMLYYSYYRVENLKPRGKYKGKIKYYNYSNSYGVENSEGVNIYGIEDENNLNTNIPITKNNRGHLSSYNAKTNVRTYDFYQENEVEGVDNKLNSKSIHTNTEVSIMTNEDISSSSNLIKKVNKLFSDSKIQTLINRFHTDIKDIDNEFITAKTSEYGLSRGRNLLKANHDNDNETGYENPYCRVWTAHHQYDKLKDRIRPFANIDIDSLQNKLDEGMRPNGGAMLSKNSVLQDNGFVKITPTREGNSFDGIQRYMFSIENLAWKDVMKDGNLSKEQIGPNQGRIMWFPPYNLKFSENVGVNWNGNNFIGRGEQIYTYTNTERSGTLDFTLLIDHPSILNQWRNNNDGNGGDYSNELLKKKEEEMLRFFAGCGELDFNPTEIPEIPEKVKTETLDPKPETKNPVPTTKKHKVAYVIFFPNNYSGYDKKNNIGEALYELYSYEFEKGNIQFKYDSDKSYEKQYLLPENKINLSKYAINNSDGMDNKFKTAIKEILTTEENLILHHLTEMIEPKKDGTKDVISIINNSDDGETLFNFSKKNTKISNIKYYGFASSHGYENLNKELCDRRLNFIKNFVNKYCTFVSPDIPTGNPITHIIQMNDDNMKGDVNTLEAKLARAAMVIFELEEKIDIIPTYNSSENSVNGVIIDKSEESNVGNNREYSVTNEEGTKALATYGDEFLYFSKIGEDDYMIKNIVNRVRHFDPAFHSITPEGFNARLTFLHQCTRQGPTSAVNGGKVNANSKDYIKYAGNLAFGRAPYCILRIGDFFHTKILIDSMSISYDNNGIQWDLNPEGAGVQPMMANISLNFKFVGGQDLTGPIERLQNAVTSNYYANASVYDKLADTGNKRNDVMFKENNE